MQTLLHCWDAKSMHTSPQESERHGHPTPPLATTSAMHGNTTCNEVYISNTKISQTCLAVFFKHKYLTMQSITPDDPLICVADYLMDVIAGHIPTTTITADTVDQLMKIFKLQAKASKDTESAQRVLREGAQAGRVIKEEHQLQHAAQKEIQQEQVTPSPTF
jgi:hypothetical protein